MRTFQVFWRDGSTTLEQGLHIGDAIKEYVAILNDLMEKPNRYIAKFIELRDKARAKKKSKRNTQPATTTETT